MKAVSIKELKEELKHHSPKEMLNVCQHFKVFK